MEYVPGGDLGSLIHQRGHLPEPDVKFMASQLLSALKYLHGMGITHRDVKPDNILIHALNPFHVKLTDFGLSKMVDSEETFLRTFCGTLLYCAPEVYSEYREYDEQGHRTRGVSKKSLPPQRYDHAVDIWSLAGVLFYALCGSPPYPAKNGTTYQELLNLIMTRPLDIRPLQEVEVSEAGIRFVRSMLHARPEYRATIDALENSFWLGGTGDLQISIENDEVDMVGDNCIDPQLENGASQLSIHEEESLQIGDIQGDADLKIVSDLTEIQQRQIPSSFDSDDKSYGSYGLPIAPVNSGNRRLFGEVPAALQSSGAIGLEHLPVPTVNRVALTRSSFSQDATITESDSSQHPPVDNGSQFARSGHVAMTMPPPPPSANDKPLDTADTEVRAARSSSIMGADSLVGHLNMHSPTSGASPSPKAPTSPAMTVNDTAISLRRPREDDEEDLTHHPWAPSDLPPKKRRKSVREIDMILPPSIFWDPKDRSTHHTNYPTMSISDLRHFELYAQAKGEKFEHGQKTFDTTMQSFRSSRSPSLEPDTDRARSEPIRDGRRGLMKRDERKLGEDMSGKIKAIETQGLQDHDYYLPRTARGSDEPVDTIGNGSPSGGYPASALQPGIGNGFQPPKRILAKLLATSDSCLPTLNLNITDPFTSWGRGNRNTIRFANIYETKVPKYGFKLLLFKPGAHNSDGLSQVSDEDMTFYISSKATFGIKVNGVNIPSSDHRQWQTPSKFWTDLRHGDLVLVWWSDVKPKWTKFRFECYRGKSKEPRKEGEAVNFIPEGDLLNEIESVSSAQEKIMLAEIDGREEQDRKVREQEKQARKSAEPKQIDVNQSFIGRPPAV